MPTVEQCVSTRVCVISLMRMTIALESRGTTVVPRKLPLDQRNFEGPRRVGKRLSRCRTAAIRQRILSAMALAFTDAIQAMLAITESRHG